MVPKLFGCSDCVSSLTPSAIVGGVMQCAHQAYMTSVVTLTHICLVDVSILIKWKSSLSVSGVSGVLFFFFLYRNSC